MSKRGYAMIIWVIILQYPLTARAQRIYAPHSVLATGNFYKIAIPKQGIYKVDGNLLSSLIPGFSNPASASIRLYGNGGAMLEEDNTLYRPDDLTENAIQMVDGGDGIFNPNDYFLFYAPGPQQWIRDSLNQQWHHRKNLYSDTSYYFISIGGTGKRINNFQLSGAPTVSVNSYDEHYFYENDQRNFLNSGKEWFGEEFSSLPGATQTRNFTIQWPGRVVSSPFRVSTRFAAKSVGTTSQFQVTVNGQTPQNLALPAVSGNFLDDYATAAQMDQSLTDTQNDLIVKMQFQPGNPGALGWLDWLEVQGRCQLAYIPGNPLFFRDAVSVSPAAIAQYTLSNTSGTESVWDITDPYQPIQINTLHAGNQTTFRQEASRLHEFAAFIPADLYKPVLMGKVTSQDLHNSSSADYVMVTSPDLLSEAQRLAQWHIQQDGFKTVLVTTDQIYNEFSSGSPDPTAIRDFVKMYYDKGRNGSGSPKYLLLFGSASYDYRNRITNNRNLVPGFESKESLSPLLTYTSDDFFGLLSDSDDISRNTPGVLLDMGIGRIPARNLTEAQTMVDKIFHYQSAASMGAWRNQQVFIADDQDQNLHLMDAESISADAKAINPLFNQEKIYLDAYPLVSSSAGARYPAVNDAIVNQVFNGALIVNYSGHGSYQRLADEAILTQDELNRFNNPDKLPLFITASCDFAPHDDPAKNSLGAGILTGNRNGAIALLTTTRLVFAYSNREINDNYLKIALKPGADGQYLRLGESVMQAKNFTSQSTGDYLNNRKFTLLGDPGLRLAYPSLSISLTGLNGHPISTADTLRSLQKYTFTGEITGSGGTLVSNFSGNLETTVYDKSLTVNTLGNTSASPVTSFQQQNAVLYKGNASITQGKFSFSFIVPKDISFQSGRGRISLYASNGITDANGENSLFSIKGAGGVTTDITGPDIKPYLNDTLFKNGGLTHENPVLLVKLFDSSGISTSGNGIGHDMTAVIDGVERELLVLNSYYTADADSYQSGQVRYQLPTLTEGPHTIRIKAWDVANNSSEVSLDCVVRKQNQLEIRNLMNYPNPFSVSTRFSFEHNQPNTDLDVTILVYNSQGGLVKNIHKKLNTGGTRNCQINWEGDNQSGAKLTKGIYLYKVIVVAGGSKVESTRQLILF